MKQTLENFAYEVLEGVRANRIDDSEIDIRYVMERIGDLRSLYLRRELSGVGTIEQVYVQDLGCLELEIVDPVECEGIDSGNYILRTKDEIPVPIEIAGKLLFTRIGPVDKTQPPFNHYKYGNTHFSGYKRFGKHLINTEYRNKRIYVWTHDCSDFVKMLDKINVQGVFDIPEDVIENPCFDTSEVYPISRWMKENIIKTLVPELVDKISRKEDTVNDGADQ